MDDKPSFFSVFWLALFYLVMVFIAWLLIKAAWMRGSFFLGCFAVILIYVLVSPFMKIDLARRRERIGLLRQREPSVTGNNLGRPAKSIPRSGRRLT